MRRFALVATLVLASCGGGDDTERTMPAPESPSSERRGVVLSLDNDRPHAGRTVTLTIENHTKWRLEYGVAYRLERRTGERWRWINRDAAFILLLKVLEPGKREREQIELPGDLKPGRYRIVKSFTAPAVDRRFDATVGFNLSGL